MFDVRKCRHRGGQVTNIQFNPTFVVDVEPVILTPACDVVTISCQANKVLLINMTCRVLRTCTFVIRKYAAIITCEGPGAVTLIHIPQLQLGVGGGRDDVLTAQELDIGHSLAVTLKHVQGLLGGPERGKKFYDKKVFGLLFFSPEVIIVDTVIC